jgi:hypothetical protein
MRSNVLEALKSLHGIPVENPVLPGTCDVNYVEGWIELKQMPCWNKNKNSDFLIEHFTPQQRIFLHKRWKKGGNVWMLLQVGPEFLLFEGEWASQLLGKCCEVMLRSCAVGQWHNVATMKEGLASWLTLNRRV